MATSITNTSIITDNLTVDTNTIHVDSANNRVGIGTTSPTVPLQVAGDIKESVSGANAQISAITDGASNYATFTATNGSRSYSMQIRPDQSNAFAIRDETGGGNRLLIDTSGYVTMPYQPAFKAAYGGRNATGTDRVISTNAGDTFETSRDIYDTGNNFDEATGRFTAPVAGTYVFVSQLMRNGNSGTVLENRIKKNGSLIWARAYASAYTSSYQSSNIITTTKMNAGDYVENFLQGTSSIYGDDSYFTGYLLG